MQCALCGGELCSKKVSEEVIEGNKHLVVQVKAEVCINCHERYYASGVVDYLIEVKKKLKHNDIDLHPIGKVYKLALHS